MVVLFLSSCDVKDKRDLRNYLKQVVLKQYISDTEGICYKWGILCPIPRDYEPGLEGIQKGSLFNKQFWCDRREIHKKHLENIIWFELPYFTDEERETTPEMWSYCTFFSASSIDAKTRIWVFGLPSKSMIPVSWCPLSLSIFGLLVYLMGIYYLATDPRNTCID